MAADGAALAEHAVLHVGDVPPPFALAAPRSLAVQLRQEISWVRAPTDEAVGAAVSVGNVVVGPELAHRTHDALLADAAHPGGGDLARIHAGDGHLLEGPGADHVRVELQHLLGGRLHPFPRFYAASAGRSLRPAAMLPTHCHRSRARSSGRGYNATLVSCGARRGGL